MTTKSDLIAAVQAAADAYYVANPTTGAAVKLALGSSGTTVTIAGQKFASGAAWSSSPSALDTEVEGLAYYLDTLGISETGNIKATLNTLIGQFNQLLSDYQSSTVPSTAIPVTPIP